MMKTVISKDLEIYFQIKNGVVYFKNVEVSHVRLNFSYDFNELDIELSDENVQPVFQLTVEVESGELTHEETYYISYNTVIKLLPVFYVFAYQGNLQTRKSSITLNLGNITHDVVNQFITKYYVVDTESWEMCKFQGRGCETISNLEIQLDDVDYKPSHILVDHPDFEQSSVYSIEMLAVIIDKIVSNKKEYLSRLKRAA